MLKLSSISFTGTAFVDRLFNLYFMFVFLMLSSDINVKNLAFTLYCRVGVYVCGVGGGGGGQDVITIQTSTMTPLSPTVSRVSTGVGGWGSGYKCIPLLQGMLVHACS